MNRDEFMMELEYLLQDIQEEDKADALSYYRDYLDEAGDDAEQAIREFGSPERIAAIIRSDIAGHLEAGGEFTERGYEDERFRDPNYQVVRRYDLPEAGADTEQKEDRQYKKQGRPAEHNNTALRVVLGIILIVIGFPMIMGVGGGVLGLLGGLFGILVACIVVAAILPLICFIAAVIAGIAGIAALAVEPFSGMLAIGIGFFMMGLAILLLIVAVQFYGRFIPWLFTGTINMISSLFHKRGREG